MSDPSAHFIVDRDGTVILVDPVAEGVISVIAAHNRKEALKAMVRDHGEAIDRFAARALERGMLPAETLIVILSVDDPLGGPLAEALMPGADWNQYRARGEKPYARGLAPRGPIREVLKDLHGGALARSLDEIAGAAILVVDGGNGDATIYALDETP